MNLDIEAVLTYPTNGPDSVTTLLLGGVFTFLSIFILPIFLVMGYFVRALRAGMAGADEPPVFDEWGTLFKEGVVAAVITFVYQLIPLAVLAAILSVSVIPLLTGSEAAAGVGILGILGGLLLWMALSFVFSFLSFAGIANYAHVGQIGAGFDIGRIIELLTAKPFLLGIVYVIALNFVYFAIISFISAIPLIGFLFSIVLFFVGPFISFYLLVITGWLIGNGFDGATGADDDDDSTSVGAPTI